ncbi:SET and MYND domain-containing protein 4, partial [Armadillidium nasatum]
MFHCTCIACEENWPIYNNNKVFMRLACPEEHCDQMVEYDGKEKMLCPSCGFNKKHENKLKEVNRELIDFDRGIDLMKRGLIEEAADVITRFQMYASKNFIPPTLCITISVKSSVVTGINVLNRLFSMSTEKAPSSDEEADENSSQYNKETQTLGVKMKTKLSQTYKPSNQEKSDQTKIKGFEETKPHFIKTKQHTLEEVQPSLPAGQTDDDSLAQQLSTLSTSGQSVCSSSKQPPCSSPKESKSSDGLKDASNLRDTTPSTSNFDEASQKELCEKLLKTDPFLSIRDSKIYFTQFYNDFCNKLKELNPAKNIKNEFSKINNDYDRIRYILQFEKLMNLKLSIAKHNSKSEEFATALERESKNYCNKPASMFMKRAWINIMMKEYEDAREDAHRSLQYHFDPSVMWNSYEVLGHCYVKIGKYNTAEGFFSQALDGMKQSNLEQERKTVTETRIISLLKSIKGKKDIGGQAITEVLTTPQVNYGVNRTLTCASDAVEVKINEKTNKGLYATKDIDPGDVIMVEKPYVSALYRENFETHCHNCFKRFKSPIPCDTCSRVWFCSDECLKEAKTGFHSSELKVLHLLYERSLGRMPPLVFRILLRLTWENIKSLRKSRKIDTRLPDSHPLHMEFDFEDKYSADDYLTTYKLVTNAQKGSFDDLFKMTIIAVYLKQCLKEVDFFKGDNVSSEDEIFVASLILRHMQNSTCNADYILEFMVMKNSLEVKSNLCLGISIYPTISLINHSCNPNVFKYYVGKDCVIRAINIIKKGEQIFANYSNILDNLGREARHNILKRQYMFHCECIACEENWPIFEDNKVYMKL